MRRNGRRWWEQVVRRWLAVPIASVLAVSLVMANVAQGQDRNGCPSGWADVSVGSLRLCAHPEHGSRTVGDAWGVVDGPTTTTRTETTTKQWWEKVDRWESVGTDEDGIEWCARPGESNVRVLCDNVVGVVVRHQAQQTTATTIYQTEGFCHNTSAAVTKDPSQYSSPARYDRNPRGEVQHDSDLDCLTIDHPDARTRIVYVWDGRNWQHVDTVSGRPTQVNWVHSPHTGSPDGPMWIDEDATYRVRTHAINDQVSNAVVTYYLVTPGHDRVQVGDPCTPAYRCPDWPEVEMRDSPTVEMQNSPTQITEITRTTTVPTTLPAAKQQQDTTTTTQLQAGIFVQGNGVIETYTSWADAYRACRARVRAAQEGDPDYMKPDWQCMAEADRKVGR